MDTPACQGKGWKAATCAVKWQQPEAASAFLPPLLQKDRLQRWGLQGESEHVWELGAESGTAIFAVGQQYLPWARALVGPFQRGLQRGLGREGAMAAARLRALPCPALCPGGMESQMMVTAKSKKNNPCN